MALFWSRFQIPNLLSRKESGHQSLLLGRSPIALVNVRSFIFWKSKKPIQYGYGDCGKQPLPKQVEPSKGSPSQCLEYLQPKRRGILGFRKKTTKPKPSNAKVEEKEEEKPETWWDVFFGPDPKASWPDPCTCRLIHRQKKKCRQQNPKLCDSRYQETAGDVFLYTETIKRRRGRTCFEPQPKPPPSFKLPKDIMIKKMRINDSDPFECEAIKTVRSAKDICTSILPPRIPYEEMRPPERRRQPFSCHRGIDSNHVVQPIKKEWRYIKNPTFSLLKSYPNIMPVKKEMIIQDTVNVEAEMGRKWSRIEQLKYLVGQKNSLQCASENP